MSLVASPSLVRRVLGRPAKRAGRRPSAALLLLRTVVGTTFLLHGLDKLGDLDAVRRSFTSLGIPLPEVTAPFVAATETAGGALLIVGAGTPAVGAALTGDMLVAALTTHIHNGFFVENHGVELVLLLGGASLALALAGPGRYSADAALA